MVVVVVVVSLSRRCRCRRCRVVVACRRRRRRRRCGEKSGQERIRPSEGHSPPGKRRQTDRSGHERIWPSESHPCPGECRRRGKSGHGKNLNEKRGLTRGRSSAALAAPASREALKLAVSVEHSGVLQRERERWASPLLAFLPVCAACSACGFLLGVRRNGGRVQGCSVRVDVALPRLLPLCPPPVRRVRLNLMAGERLGVGGRGAA